MARLGSGKGWFCTWPQCPMSVDDFLPSLLVAMPPVKWAVCAQEKHADGNSHLHAAIFLERVFQPRTWDSFDDVTGQHGNYQPMRSVKGSLAYLQKEDPNPLFYGDVPMFGVGSKSKTDKIANMLEDGATMQDVNAEYPGFTLMHKRKMEEYAGWQAGLALKKEKLSWPGLAEYSGSDPVTQSVCDWLNRNMSAPREFKQTQMWLYGPPDSRKTSMCRMLEEFFTIYWTPNSELFYDGYDDDHDLIVMDEFREGKPCEWLNLWLEGSTMMVRRKGLAPVCKRRNQPIIICSNYQPHELYSDATSLACVNARVEVFRLLVPLDLNNMKFVSPVVPQHLSIDEDDEASQLM